MPLAVASLLRRMALLTLVVVPCLVLAAPFGWASAAAVDSFGVLGLGALHTSVKGRDFGVGDGWCDRAGISVHAGRDGGTRSAVDGDAFAAARADDSDTYALLAATIGRASSERMDTIDRACVGYALALAPPRTRVDWINGNTRVHYQLTVLDRPTDFGRCSEFRLEARSIGMTNAGQTRVCFVGGNRWELTAAQAVAASAEN
jgi:hypothetical protein